MLVPRSRRQNSAMAMCDIMDVALEPIRSKGGHAGVENLYLELQSVIPHLIWSFHAQQLAICRRCMKCLTSLLFR